MSTESDTADDDLPEHMIEAGGETYHKAHVGGALVIMGGALTVFIITAPIGIPVAILGLWMWWKYRKK